MYRSIHRVENTIHNQCRLGNIEVVMKKIEEGESPIVCKLANGIIF